MNASGFCGLGEGIHEIEGTQWVTAFTVYHKEPYSHTSRRTYQPGQWFLTRAGAVAGWEDTVGQGVTMIVRCPHCGAGNVWEAEMVSLMGGLRRHKCPCTECGGSMDWELWGAARVWSEHDRQLVFRYQYRVRGARPVLVDVLGPKDYSRRSRNARRRQTSRRNRRKKDA